MSTAKPDTGIDIARRIFTTNPGLETVVRAEFRKRCFDAGADPDHCDAEPDTIRGRVTASAPAPVMDAVAPAMRSIHHIRRPVTRFRLDAADPLGGIERVLTEAEIPEMADAASFRVSCNRRGEHPFSSQDVMRVAGAALNARHGTPVDLTGYAVDVNVDVVEDLCTVDVAVTHAALSNRHPRAQVHPAALRANIAFAAVRFANLDVDAEGVLLDPYCGSGTILLEAGAAHPRLRLEGWDWDERAAAGARANLAEAGLAGRAAIHGEDSSDFADRYRPGEVTALVTNPPFGRKLGRSINFPAFYRRLFENAAAVLPPRGRMVVLADRTGALRRGLAKAGGFRTRRAKLIQMSGVWPTIYVLERKP
ncbi:hypothetical protein PC39_10707 [Salinisphaera sp. PC39]|uniref:methyltransferase n=1 Tax=Salinisphaera sp. PC39 TaxID=1304156 RepID=UPI00333FF31A